MMNEKTFAAPRARATAIPALTLQETTITPTQALDSGKATLNQGLNTVIHSTQDFVAAGKANLDAVGTSGRIWAAGVQELTRQFASTVKASYEDSVATFKAISTAKSIKEALDLQGTYVKSTFSKAVAESTKLTDASIQLTEQALAPLKDRMTVTVGSFAKAA